MGAGLGAREGPAGGSGTCEIDPGEVHSWARYGDETLVAHFGEAPSPFTTLALEPFGGAVGRVGGNETAFPHRLANFSLVILGIWTDPAEQATQVRWVRELWEAMQPYCSDAVYVNYLDADEADRVLSAYGSATYRRLQLLKEKYDPGNFFHMNQNIGPAKNA